MISDEELIKGYIDKIADFTYDFIRKYSVNTFIIEKESFKYKLEESINSIFKNSNTKSHI